MKPRNENPHYAVLMGIGNEDRDLPDEPTKSIDSILSAGSELIKDAFSDILENFAPGQSPQDGKINGSKQKLSTDFATSSMERGAKSFPVHRAQFNGTGKTSHGLAIAKLGSVGDALIIPAE
eukprot:11633703-Ditylum_brightwellii.AAC.1